MNSFKHFILLFLFFSFSNISNAQKESDFKYSDVQDDFFAVDVTKSGYNEKTWFWGSSFDYAVFQFSNILQGYLLNKKEQQQLEISKQQNLQKVSIIKEQYKSYDSFPSKISDGWHNIIATDNFNFCKDAKVYVQNNRVKKFVIDNCIPLNVNATGEIKKAKSVATLKNTNGQELCIIDMYFLYDIEEQILVESPIKPGFVCFWTDISNYDNILLDFDGKRMEFFSAKFYEEPNCFEDGMICRILKPGTYTFLARGRGAIDWSGTIDVKSGQCLKIRLGR